MAKVQSKAIWIWVFILWTLLVYAAYVYGPGERPESPLIVGLAVWIGPVALCWWLRLLLNRSER
jgi:hypothetical protein